MSQRFAWRQGWIWAGMSALLLAAVVPALILALDAGFFRGPFVAYVQKRFGRQVRVDGVLQLRLWSPHPRIIATQVSIGNPSWIAPGEFARADRLTLTYAAPGLTHGAVLEAVAMEGATLHLLRDEAGRANWQLSDVNGGNKGRGAPFVRELSAPDVHLLLDDRRRHLQFDGIVSASSLGPSGEAARLHIVGDGQFNGRQGHLDFNGDLLERPDPKAPYAFEFIEEANATRLSLRGILPKPFNLKFLDANFEAVGANLRDLSFLTGLKFPITGSYRLSGSVAGQSDVTRYDNLKLVTGQSDAGGYLSSALVNGRTRIEGAFTSGEMRLSDFGVQRAGAAQPPAESGRMFSDAQIGVAAVRGGDAALNFQVAKFDAGRLMMHSVAGHVQIDHGVAESSLKGAFVQGEFESHLRMDANPSVPEAEASLKITDLQLSTLHRGGGEAPWEGLLRVQVALTGRGESLHQIAASTNGSVSMELPQGTIRASLAESMGVDLRGLGLILTRSKREVQVRCAAARFEAHEGKLSSKAIVVDTVPVAIQGEGSIDLDSESVRFVLHGDPKEARLVRLDAPVLLQGTLMKPSFTIQTRDSSVRLLDPGHGRNVDCVSLLTRTAGG